MKYMDHFFDQLPKICKKSKLNIVFAGFTDLPPQTIDEHLIKFCDQYEKHETVILYVQESDFKKLENMAELRICHAYVVKDRKLSTLDKNHYQITLKQFVRYLSEKEKTELDWNGDIHKPLYMDSYHDLHQFCFTDEGTFTNPFIFVIKQICAQAGKGKTFQDLFVAVLYLYYQVTGIEPCMIEGEHFLNYGSNSNLGKLTIKKLKSILDTLQQQKEQQ